MAAQHKSLQPSFTRLQLDKLDKQIVKLLYKDGRIAYTEIAKRLDSAEATIRYRVQRLMDAGAITVQACINPDKLGYRQMAHISFSCTDLGQAHLIAAELALSESVSYVAFVTGSHDVILEITYTDNDDLMEFLSKLRSHPGVISTQTQIVMRLLKSQYPYQIEV